MRTAGVIVWIPVVICAGAVKASLVTHAAAGYGGATLLGPDVYGSTHAMAETGYAGAWMNAEAWAAYGRVGARASVEASPALHEVNRGLAEGAFIDRLRVDGPSGAGFIIYHITITGSAEGEADAHLFLRHGNDPDEEVAGEVTSSGEFESLPHAIAFGQEFQMGLTILLLATMEMGESGISVGDFSAGAALTGIDVLDGQMNPIGGWSIGSESGTSYPVPAPAGLWCLAGLVAVRRTRRNKLNEGTSE